MKIKIFILISVISIIIGCKVYSDSKTRKNIQQLKNAQYIDVRTQEEFDSGNHPKSINIPLSQFNKNLSKVDKNRPIVVVCRSGNRSGKAKKILESLGYQNVINGGSWTNL